MIAVDGVEFGGGDDFGQFFHVDGFYVNNI